MERKSVEAWKEKVTVVLHSKQSEFEMLGYSKISTEEIWDCLLNYVWKNNPEQRLYEVVQSIFQLRIHTYMDYVALHSLQNDDELMSSIQAVMNQQ